MHRFKYYHAWLLADAICNASGLGFNGYAEDGSARWDLHSNIDILGFEVVNLIIAGCFKIKSCLFISHS